MKLLPFPKKPMFLCYHNRAFPFGVVQANSPEDITKWVCTKGVYCFFHPEQKMNKFCFAVDDLWSLGERLWKSIFLAKKTERFYKNRSVSPENSDYLMFLYIGPYAWQAL